jgi:hypothetical protein
VCVCVCVCVCVYVCICKYVEGKSRRKQSRAVSTYQAQHMSVREVGKVLYIHAL